MIETGRPASAWRGRCAWAEVDLDALTHNTRVLKQRARRARLAAVVKANAYGHGAIICARAALDAGAGLLAVACVEEGRELREAGIAAPVLVMGSVPVSLAEEIVDLRLTPTVNSRQLALALASFAGRRGLHHPVHLKVDTGLNRYGLPPAELIALAESLRELPGLCIEGLYTHFASGDEADKTFTQQQYAEFAAVAQRLDWIPLKHVGNTAIVLDMPELSLDIVRPGIGLYGCYPSDAVSHETPLQPVLSLKARVARLKRLAPGESIGYGRTWTAREPAAIALVPIGYGDGLPRLLSNRGSVLIRGRRAPLAGRISMDMCVADVTAIPEVQVDDEVVLIGRQGTEAIPAEEVAALAGTISYEVLCSISPRVPRLYTRNGCVVSVQSLLKRPTLESVQASR